MSDLRGADLDQLDVLASAYQQRGAEIASRAGDLDQRLATTVTSFQTSLADLQRRVASANDALLQDVDELARTAATTTWTGANRAAFDRDLEVLRAGIVATADDVTSRIVELERHGVTPFAERLTVVGREASGAGEAAEQAGRSMRDRIDGQRVELQDAADRGWSAV